MFRALSLAAGHARWLASGIPDTLAFLAAAAAPRRAQCRALRRILHANRGTEYGRRHGFDGIRDPDAYAARVPVSDYAELAAAIEADALDTRIAEPVRGFLPTSGSGGAAKWIPWTDALQREFLAGVRPWIVGLYLAHPSLLLGGHYWSVSPQTAPRDPPRAAGGDRAGFADDTEYLGLRDRRLARRLLAVPGELARVEDPELSAYLTLLCLAGDAGLRLVSVWHPSFFTVLLDALPRRRDRLVEALRTGRVPEAAGLHAEVREALRRRLRPCPARAAAVAAVDLAQPDAPQRLWPRLRLISCWADAPDDPWAARLRLSFPRARIQPKGLVATEGIVSIPFGRVRGVAALRSHYLEFVEPATGVARRAWELERGAEYTVLLTTGGGLYRYRLQDRVRVESRFLRAPCLRFLGREGLRSDLVGEKLDGEQVEAALARARRRWPGAMGFAMLAPGRPADGRAGYVCYAAAESADDATLAAWGAIVDEELQEGYHYRHARRTGQLAPCRVFRLTGAPEAEVQDRLAARGARRGGIKLPAFSPDPDWDRVLRGRFVS